jgi:hypothetical protein
MPVGPNGALEAIGFPNGEDEATGPGAGGFPNGVAGAGVPPNGEAEFIGFEFDANGDVAGAMVFWERGSIGNMPDEAGLSALPPSFNPSKGLTTLYFAASFLNISTSRPCRMFDSVRPQTRRDFNSAFQRTLYFSRVLFTSTSLEGLCF